MSKRQQLIGSLLIGAFLVVIAIVFPAASAAGIVGAIWLYLAPLICAVRYSKEMDQPTGQLVLLCLFLPVIAPSLIAASSKPEPPTLSPETVVYGKPIREWGVGEAQHAFRGGAFFGRGGKILIQAADGLIVENGKTAIAVRWSDIQEVYQTLQDQYMNGVQSARIRSYQLVLPNGRKCVFDQRYGDVENLGLLVQTKVAENLLPTIVKRIEIGESTAFGPVVLDLSSINLLGQQLPWDEVASVTINAGYLVVARRPRSSAEFVAKRSKEVVIGALTRISGRTQPVLSTGDGVQWKKVTASKVPNLSLLLQVSNAIISLNSEHGKERKE